MSHYSVHSLLALSITALLCALALSVPPRAVTAAMDGVETELPEQEVETARRSHYVRHCGFRMRSDVPGHLFFPDEPVDLIVSVNKPQLAVTLAVSGSVQDSAGNPAGDIGRFELNAASDYEKRLPIIEVGRRDCFAIHWQIADAGDPEITHQAVTYFAVIPENEHEQLNPDSPFGVNVHFTQGWPGSINEIIRRVGIKWIRDHIGGEYDAEAGEYRSLDPTLVLAREHNLCFLPLSPYWSANELVATAGVWRHDAAAKQAEAYARRHGQYVDVYELYNEPHIFDHWTGRFGGSWNGGGWLAPFADFGKQITQALWRGDPGALVLWPEGDVFVLTRQFVEAGARPELNAIAPHTYSLHQPSYPEDQPFIRSISQIKPYLREAGLTNQIWSTEVGFPSYTAPEGHTGFHRPLTERQQADVLARMMILHLAAGITKVFYYDFYEDGSDPTNAEHRFGIIRCGSMEPKPAVVAYANVIHWLTDAEFAGRYPTGGNGEGFAFRAPPSGELVLVAWVKHGETTEQWLVLSGARKVTVTDIFGNESRLRVRDGKLLITLTESPVFVTGLAPQDIEPFLTPIK